MDDLAEPLGVEAERLGAEMLELGLRRLGRQQPDAGALLPRVLGEDELRAALETRARTRASSGLLAGLQELEPARGHQVDEQHELAVVGGEEQPLAAPLGAAEAPALERVERRVERLQRRDVRRPGLRDREGRDGVVELAPPRLHLRELGHVLTVPGYASTAAGPPMRPGSAAADVSCSGNSRRVRSGESRTGSSETKPRHAPTKSAVRRPKAVASTPPTSEPSGIVPQTRSASTRSSVRAAARA